MTDGEIVAMVVSGASLVTAALMKMRSTSSKELVAMVRKEIRNAATIHQLQLDKSWLLWQERIRKEIMDALRESKNGA